LRPINTSELLRGIRSNMTDKLPTIARFVTTHNAEGKAVFTDAVGEAAEKKPIDGGRVVFGLQYCSEEFPVDMNSNKDLDAYQRYQGEPPGLVISSGTVLRTVGELKATRPSVARADVDSRHGGRTHLADASHSLARLWDCPGG